MHIILVMWLGNIGNAGNFNNVGVMQKSFLILKISAMLVISVILVISEMFMILAMWLGNISHWVKSVRIRIFSGLYVFSRIRIRKTPNTGTFHTVRTAGNFSNIDVM